MGADREQIDVRDMFSSALPDEVTFYESGVGQIPLPNICSRDYVIQGKNGYHPAAGTMTVTAKIAGMEIAFEVSGTNFDAYNKLLDGTSGQKRSSLTLRFLRQHNMPYKITGWQL